MARPVKRSKKNRIAQTELDEPTPEQLERAYAAMPELQEPDKAARRAAFIVVLVLVVAVGIAGAAIEFYLKPLLANPPTHTAPQPREIIMRINPTSYEPAAFQLRTGESVRWVIDATNATGCGFTMFVPDLNISRALNPTFTVIEFTPGVPGNIPFSCASTELHGYFSVT